MKRIQSRPYLTPQRNRLEVEKWEIQIGDQIQSLGESISDWDPASSIEVRARVRIDIEGILKDCELAGNARFRMAIIWDSSGTRIRGSGTQVNVSGSSEVNEIVLSATIDGKLLAESLILTVSLLFIDSDGQRYSLMPRHPGSILLQSSTYKVQLEGNGVRFPTEVIDFSSTPYPQDAGWFLSWDPDSLDQTLLGDVRLYLNAKHPRVVSAVTTMDENSFGIREAVRLDLAHTIIHGALSNDEFVQNPDRFAKGSIGSAARAMIRLYFSGYSIKDIQTMIRQSNLFSAFLQDKMRAFVNEW